MQRSSVWRVVVSLGLIASAACASAPPPPAATEKQADPAQAADKEWTMPNKN